jgi:hypothetical protein
LFSLSKELILPQVVLCKSLEAKTPAQHAIVEHYRQLRSAGSQFWFIIQCGWVRDLKITDGMNATEGFQWTDELLKS